MNGSHRSSHRLVANILLLSLCLQGCVNSPISVIPKEKQTTASTQALNHQNSVEQLIGKECTAEKGHIVTFHEQEGQLRADVTIHGTENSKKPTVFKSLPVRVAKDIDLHQISCLNTEEQKRVIHFNFPKNGQPGRVSVFRAGLQGGMKEDEQPCSSQPKNEKGKEKVDTDQGGKGDENKKRLTQLNKDGDDRSLVSHGKDRKYWYSMSDGFRLLIGIRKEKLKPIDIAGREGEKYTAHRENNERVFIANPYHVDNFSIYFRDDIATITGQHTNTSNEWRHMPKMIVIPILYGLHWRCIRIEIDYDSQEYSVLYDDPYGVDHFPVQEKQKLLKIIREHLKVLISKELGTEVDEVDIKEYEKQIDQQGNYINSFDCGPIIFNNIKDYSRSSTGNEVYAAASGDEDDIYSLNPFGKTNHENKIIQIRAANVTKILELEGIETSSDRLEDIKKAIKRSSESKLEQLCKTQYTTEIVDKISQLPPDYREMFFSILEQKRPLGEGESYSEEELNECYTLLLGAEDEEPEDQLDSSKISLIDSKVKHKKKDLNKLCLIYQIIHSLEENEIDIRNALISIGQLCGGEDRIKRNDYKDPYKFYIRNRYGYFSRGSEKGDPEVIQNGIFFERLYQLSIILKLTSFEILTEKEKDLRVDLKSLQQKIVHILHEEQEYLNDKKILSIVGKPIPVSEGKIFNTIHQLAYEHYEKKAFERIQTELSKLNLSDLDTREGRYIFARKLMIAGELCKELHEEDKLTKTLTYSKNFSDFLKKCGSLRNTVYKRGYSRIIHGFQGVDKDILEKANQAIQRITYLFAKLNDLKILIQNEGEDKILPMESENMNHLIQYFEDLLQLFPKKKKKKRAKLLQVEEKKQKLSDLNEFHQMCVIIKSAIELHNVIDGTKFKLDKEKEIARANKQARINLLSSNKKFIKKIEVEENLPYSEKQNKQIAQSGEKLKKLEKQYESCLDKIRKEEKEGLKELEIPESLTDKEKLKKFFKENCEEYLKQKKGKSNDDKTSPSPKKEEEKPKAPVELINIPQELKSTEEVKKNRYATTLKEYEHELSYLGGILIGEPGRNIDRESKKYIIDFSIALLGELSRKLKEQSEHQETEKYFSYTFKKALNISEIIRNFGPAHDMLSNHSKIYGSLHSKIFPAFVDIHAINLLYQYQFGIGQEDINILFLIGHAFYRLHKLPEALDIYIKALAMCEENMEHGESNNNTIANHLTLIAAVIALKIHCGPLEDIPIILEKYLKKYNPKDLLKFDDDFTKQAVMQFLLVLYNVESDQEKAKELLSYILSICPDDVSKHLVSLPIDYKISDDLIINNDIEVNIINRFQLIANLFQEDKKYDETIQKAEELYAYIKGKKSNIRNQSSDKYLWYKSSSLMYLLMAYTSKNDCQPEESIMSKMLKIILALKKNIEEYNNSIELPTIINIYCSLLRADFSLLKHEYNMEQGAYFTRFNDYRKKVNELKDQLGPTLYLELSNIDHEAINLFSNRDDVLKNDFIIFQQYFENIIKIFPNYPVYRVSLNLGIINFKYGILLYDKNVSSSHHNKTKAKKHLMAAINYFNTIKQDINFRAAEDRLYFHYFYGICCKELGILESNNELLNKAVVFLKEALNIAPTDNDTQQALWDVCEVIILSRISDEFDKRDYPGSSTTFQCYIDPTGISLEDMVSFCQLESELSTLDFVSQGNEYSFTLDRDSLAKIFKANTLDAKKESEYNNIAKKVLVAFESQKSNFTQSTSKVWLELIIEGIEQKQLESYCKDVLKFNQSLFYIQKTNDDKLKLIFHRKLLTVLQSLFNV